MRRAWVLSALTLSACADVCARAQLEGDAFQRRHAACSAPDTLPAPTFDAAACKASMGACSAADAERLHAWLDCIGRLPACTPDTRDEFSAAVLACADGTSALSPGCFRP